MAEITQEEPAYTCNCFDEEALFNYLKECLPKAIDLNEEDGSNNVFVYNEMNFYQITQQQELNDYNIAIGMIADQVLSSGGGAREEINKIYGDIMKRTFEIHCWSVKQNNTFVSKVAQLLKLALTSHPHIVNKSDINTFYKTLDNTNLAMTDCVFTCEFVCQDVFEKSDEGLFEDATIEYNYINK